MRAGVELSGWRQRAAISSISMANQRCRGAVSMKLCFQDLAKAFQAGGTSDEFTSVGFLTAWCEATVQKFCNATKFQFMVTKSMGSG